MIVELNEQSFDKETSQGLKLVEFYATWCMYCKKQRIELQEFENTDVWVGIVDGDESPQLVKRFEIDAYPTFVLLKGGRKVLTFSGFHSRSQLLAKLMSHMQA